MNTRISCTIILLFFIWVIPLYFYGSEPDFRHIKNGVKFAQLNQFSASSQVNSDSDDAEQRMSGGLMKLLSPDLTLVDHPNHNQLVGLRFNNIAVPPGAIIDEASVQFTVDETDSGPTPLTIWGQDADNPVTFIHSDYDISSRSFTTESVLWNPPAWTTIGASGPDQKTPDLAAIIQSIIDRPGWVEGNSIVIIIGGQGVRTADSHDGSSTNAPLLNIDFHVCLPEGSPCDDGDPLTINDRFDEFCNCSGPPAQVAVCTKVFLTSAFNPFSTTPGTQLVTYLRDANLIPLNQPYTAAPWSYFGNESFASIDDVPADMVDWVLVTIREGSNFDNMVTQYAGILKSNGEIKSIDGNNEIVTLTDAEGYYIEITHSNHLSVVSANALLPDDTNSLCCDFTMAHEAAYINPIINNPAQATLGSISGTHYALPVGNAQKLDCHIDINDINALFIKFGSTGFYGPEDINLDGQVDVNDINMLFPFYNWNCHKP